jgi:endogenous inhibitor of DNA gyrase (YacG/DUF329 family)
LRKFTVRVFATLYAHQLALCGILNHMQFRCPICKKPTDSETNAEFPFCSERCKLYDLGNWSSEKYVISEPANDDTLFEDITRESRDEHKN